MKKVLFIVILLLASCPLLMSNVTAEGNKPIVTLDVTTITPNPPSEAPEVGQAFEVNVTISNVTDLFDWQIMLIFDTTILNATDVTEGPFLKQGGDTYFPTPDINNDYNATHGYVFAGSTLMGGTGVNGSGVLATICFVGEAEGISNLVLDVSGQIYGFKTLLENSEGAEIPFDIVVTQVQVVPEYIPLALLITFIVTATLLVAMKKKPLT